MVLDFDGVFVSFRGKHSGECVCLMQNVSMDKPSHYYVALSDSIFSSILARGCRKLRSLDVSASASRLTDYSLHLIGWYYVTVAWNLV